MKRKALVIALILMSVCLFAGGSSEGAREFYSYASFNTGTFQYMYAAAFSGELQKIHPEYNVTAEATSSTSENLDLVYRGEAVFASASGGAFRKKGKEHKDGPFGPGTAGDVRLRSLFREPGVSYVYGSGL